LRAALAARSTPTGSRASPSTIGGKLCAAHKLWIPLLALLVIGLAQLSRPGEEAGIRYSGGDLVGASSGMSAAEKCRFSFRRQQSLYPDFGRTLEVRSS
jgi:hypothetical protein